MNGPISRTCALSVGWSLARESSFNLVHLHRRRRQWVARSPSHSEIISPSLPLSFPVLSLSFLSQWTCNPVSAGPVGGRGGGSHAAVVVSLSSIQSLLYFPLGMIAHVGRPTRVRKESVRDGRRGNGERVGDTETAVTYFALLSGLRRARKQIRLSLPPVPA